MHNQKLHIIFPVDETTDFLNDIVSYLGKNISNEVIIHRINDVKEQLEFKKNDYKLIPNDSLILFLGHGSSFSLKGPPLPKHSLGPLVDKEELSIFCDKNLVLLSCRSAEYLRDYGKSAGIKMGIGFPNLITDPLETEYAENMERESGVSDEEIEIFKKILIDITKYTLADFYNQKISFFELHNRFKLRVRKSLINYYSEHNQNAKTPLGKLLYDLNEGITIFSN